MDMSTLAHRSIADELRIARRARIFFAHHSVGANLLAGVKRIDDRHGGGLDIVELEQADATPQPAWFHASGGRNTDPASKVDFFAAALRRCSALRPGMALMKFCFVDVGPHTDTDALLGYYARAIDALKQEHPEITFAHVTVPLVRRPMQMKWRLHRAIGRLVWEDEANVKRCHFNERLQAELAGDPIFDLARAESTRPDGSREVFEHRGRSYHALDPRYTDDGGHLNQLGQLHVGAEMIGFVAAALADSAPPPS